MKKVRIHLVASVITGCLLAIALHSCSLFKKVDEEEIRWEERAEVITVGCKTEYEKAKAIYDWMAENIIYDYTYSICYADECWEKRTGVCSAFSEVYVKLAKGCGLSAEKISGKCRNSESSDGNGSHAWNMVKTEKGWILLDVTWGSCNGHGDNLNNGNAWTTYGESSKTWWDVDPCWMIFTHFPEKSKDQLMGSPVSSVVYMNLPRMSPAAGRWGWDARRTLEYFIQHPHAMVPVFYIVPNELWDTNVFLEYPCSMEAGQQNTIRIRNLNPSYLPRDMEQCGDDIYSCTASAGFRVRIGGNSVMCYPSVGSSYFPEFADSERYPCK